MNRSTMYAAMMPYAATITESLVMVYWSPHTGANVRSRTTGLVLLRTHSVRTLTTFFVGLQAGRQSYDADVPIIDKEGNPL